MRCLPRIPCIRPSMSGLEHYMLRYPRDAGNHFLQVIGSRASMEVQNL